MNTLNLLSRESAVTQKAQKNFSLFCIVRGGIMLAAALLALLLLCVIPYFTYGDRTYSFWGSFTEGGMLMGMFTAGGITPLFHLTYLEIAFLIAYLIGLAMMAVGAVIFLTKG